MNKKNTKHNSTSNLIFSACLVTAFVICSYFFEGIVTTSTGLSDTLKGLIVSLIFVVFGFFLFYATRVGDGKQVRRFSLATLIIMDLPALYIILASVVEGLPFSEQISSSTVILYAAAVALGYGIPYTFFSGYEIEEDEETEEYDNSEDKNSESEDEEDEDDIFAEFGNNGSNGDDEADNEDLNTEEKDDIDDEESLSEDKADIEDKE